MSESEYPRLINSAIRFGYIETSTLLLMTNTSPLSPIGVFPPTPSKSEPEENLPAM